MTDNRTTELLPCPFCGGEATVEHIGRSGYYYVACNTAYCCDFGKYDTEAEAIAAWNTRAEHGTLTAEQIGEAIERNFMKICVLDDGKPVEWREDWVCRVGIDYRAIADELNELGSGTCEFNVVEEFIPGKRQRWNICECSNCGFIVDERFKCCPNCGKRIRKKVDA